jgi:phosphoribosylformylglycinamidine synthase PurS subunit
VFRSKITVTLRPSILDPQGKAVELGMHSLGYQSVGHVRIGKFIEMQVDVKDAKTAERVTREVCEKLLANPVMEDFTVSVEPAKGND